MARTVFLHIGTMKSATTYLQGLFDLNAKPLADAGLLWPSSTAAFVALADFRGTPDVDRPGRAGSWRRLIDQVERYDGDVLLSNELLAPLGRAKIERLASQLRPATLEVIVTARDLARVIPSHWQTTMKNGSRVPWTDFAATVCRDAPPDDDTAGDELWTWFWRRHDVPEMVRRWRASTGAARAHVVTVPPPHGRSDPLTVARRFAAAVDVRLPTLQEPAYANSSVGAHSAELLRRLNEQVAERSRGYYRWGIKEGVAAALTERNAQEPRFGLSLAQHQWVRGRAQRMIEEIRHGGAVVHGDLADLLPTEVAESSRSVDPAEATDAELLDSALVALGHLVETVGDLILERERRLRSGR